MKRFKSTHMFLLLIVIIGVSAIIACQPPGAAVLSVVSTSPLNGATVVAINTVVTATFSEDMTPSSLNTTTFTVAPVGGAPVPGTVVYNAGSFTASFAPSAVLTGAGTVYVATITTGALASNGITGLAVNKVWTFTTSQVRLGPAPVLLGTSGNYVILGESTITTVPTSVITGDLGLSPNAASFYVGFGLTKHTGYSTSPQVTGRLYAADDAPPTPTNLTTATTDMTTAYTDAAGRAASPANSGLATPIASPKTFAGGVYAWTTNLAINANVTLTGQATDTWIFQIPGTLTVAPGVHIILAGGAQAANIVWVVGGATLLDTTTVFYGIILDQTAITLNSGATLTGRALSQTAVTVNTATVTTP